MRKLQSRTLPRKRRKMNGRDARIEGTGSREATTETTNSRTRRKEDHRRSFLQK